MLTKTVLRQCMTAEGGGGGGGGVGMGVVLGCESKVTRDHQASKFTPDFDSLSPLGTVFFPQ